MCTASSRKQKIPAKLSRCIHMSGLGAALGAAAEMVVRDTLSHQKHGLEQPLDSTGLCASQTA